MKTFKELLETHGTGKTKITVRVDPYEVFMKNNLYRDHRHYIESLFKDKGYYVTRHNPLYDGEDIKECGLIYYRSDSDLNPVMEVTGIVGVNLREVDAT